jgi:hypothetical protein
MESFSSCVVGTIGPHNDWLFAEGSTRNSFSQWLCLENPGGTDAHVSITYYPSSGAPIKRTWVVGANSRVTVNVNQGAGPNKDLATEVSSDQPVVTECPVYFDYLGWDGGHDVMGFILR